MNSLVATANDTFDISFSAPLMLRLTVRPRTAATSLHPRTSDFLVCTDAKPRLGAWTEAGRCCGIDVCVCVWSDGDALCGLWPVSWRLVVHHSPAAADTLLVSSLHQRHQVLQRSVQLLRHRPLTFDSTFFGVVQDT